MSSTRSRPLDQPNHRRTARKVSRASSRPERTSSSPPVSSPTAVENRLPVGRLTHSRRREGHNVLYALVVGELHALAHEVDQPVGLLVIDRTVGRHPLGQAEGDLVRRRRQRMRTWVGVDDEQVHGVRPDVDDAEPHALTVATERSGRTECVARGGPRGETVVDVGPLLVTQSGLVCGAEDVVEEGAPAGREDSTAASTMARLMTFSCTSPTGFVRSAAPTRTPAAPRRSPGRHPARRARPRPRTVSGRRRRSRARCRAHR